MEFESIIIHDRRFEIEVQPVLGRQLLMENKNFYCVMWAMIGTKRNILYSIEYGSTYDEARSNMDRNIKAMI